jgi:translation initiation factor IF-2
MRARGAQVTDIVVLVVAADDGLMPQTIEAISHAKNAGVPMVVAINKVDLPQANPDKVKQELLQHSVVLEEFGGNVLATAISAKKGTNIDELLEQILLQSEILDLKADPARRPRAPSSRPSSTRARGRWPRCSCPNGTLTVGSDFICGMHSGRVRALLDERGKTVKSAGPAIPVQILGLTGVPWPATSSSRSTTPRRPARSRPPRAPRPRGREPPHVALAVTLEDFMKETATGGPATSSSSSRPTRAARRGARRRARPALERRGARRHHPARRRRDHRGRHPARQGGGRDHHRLPRAPRHQGARGGRARGRRHQALPHHLRGGERRRAALEGMLKPEQREVILAEAEVRELFKVRASARRRLLRAQRHVHRGAKVRVIRDGVEIYDGNLGSLRRFKEDVKRSARASSAASASRTSTTSRSATCWSATAPTRSPARCSPVSSPDHTVEARGRGQGTSTSVRPSRVPVSFPEYRMADNRRPTGSQRAIREEVANFLAKA